MDEQDLVRRAGEVDWKRMELVMPMPPSAKIATSLFSAIVFALGSKSTRQGVRITVGAVMPEATSSSHRPGPPLFFGSHWVRFTTA